ncbi:MAG TPA: AAA family ATPase [Dermatophilaceae bacterium]|nr:AAA family ATPase [Dermatophilaceae bacterium]
MILLWEADPISADNMRLALGEAVTTVESAPAALRGASDDPSRQLLVVGPDVDLDSALSLSAQLRLLRPEVGVLLLRRRVDVSVLGQALRAGVREVVSADDVTGLSEASARSLELTRRLGGASQDGGRREGKIVTVFSAKGGVGKTTVSTNLAAQLAANGSARVLLVDLDLDFGDVAIALGMMPERTIVDLVPMTGHIDVQGLASVVTRSAAGIDALCASPVPGDAERVPAALVGEVLRVAQRSYDYVVVDTPPAFTEQVLVTFDASDVSVLIGTLDVPAVKNLKLTLETLQALGHDRDSWVVVLNRSDALVGLTVDDVTAALHHPIAVQIPNSLDVPASVNRGVALVLDRPKHPASQAIRQLASTVAGPDQAAHPAVPALRPSASRRFLRRVA